MEHQEEVKVPTPAFLVPAIAWALAVTSANAETMLRIVLDEPGPVIEKNVYGQFAEHLGRGIYGGLWVGPDSSIPNTRGWRSDVVEALRAIRVPVVRWPGGCFADTYHWRDGIGPRKERPVRVNSLWGGVTDDNAVGTHEFFDLVEQLGAEAYVSGNLGTGTPAEMADWLEYMTSDSTSDLAELRRRNGREKPFRLHHFGIGNESWGCGGHMSPAYYTSLYKHWGTFLRTPWGVKTNMVASGGHGEGPRDRTRWSAYLTEHIEPNFLLGFDAISFHYYTHPKGNVWTERGSATGFPEAEWMSTLARAREMEGHLAANAEVMDRNDPEKKVALFVDEWGVWTDPTEGTNPAFLEQQNTLRDALVAALHFHIFHDHADRVRMTNIAQMVNVLQAMVLTQDGDMVLTPTYFAYQLHLPFQGATSLPTRLSGGRPYVLGEHSMPAVSASAARSEDGRVHVALVNVDPKHAQTVTLQLGDGSPRHAEGHLLTAPAMDAHNTFGAPNRVRPVPWSAEAEGDAMRVELPAKSVVVLALDAEPRDAR